jgi:hypothetical protein
MLLEKCGSVMHQKNKRSIHCDWAKFGTLEQVRMNWRQGAKVHARAPEDMLERRLTRQDAKLHANASGRNTNLPR